MPMMCIKLSNLLYECIPFVRAVAAVKRLIIGLSTISAKENVIPKVARFVFESGNRAMIAVTIGCSTPINIHIMAKGNQKTNIPF